MKAVETTELEVLWTHQFFPAPAYGVFLRTLMAVQGVSVVMA